MKIEDLIKLPEDAKTLKERNGFVRHYNPKSGNYIESWYNQANLFERRFFDESGNGFGIVGTGFLWLYAKKRFRVLKKEAIIIGRSKSVK